MSRRRVVITGIGPITGFGVGIDPLWPAMLEGRSAIRRITRFDPSGFPCKAAAELSDDLFNVREVVPKSYRKATKVMARDIELAVGAALSAVRDAGLTTRGTDPDHDPTVPPTRFGCQIGAGLIAADADELTMALSTSVDAEGRFDIRHWGSPGMQDLTPLWLLKYLPNMLACHVTIIHDCQGPSNTITCAEASSGLSVGESMRIIERGGADACLSGGAEHKHNVMGLLRQHFARRLAPTGDHDDSATIVRPFANDATGTILGEGGGILVLEADETARARGARIYCEVAGFAASQSFCPDTIGVEPDPDDDAADAAIENALADAGIGADDVDAIVPFGSGIPHVDRLERSVIERVFGDRSSSIPLITVVPNVGNCCAGTGAVALIVGVKALFEQMLPARLNSSTIEGLDAGATASRPASLRHVLVTSTSLGGQNAAIVLRRAEA